MATQVRMEVSKTVNAKIHFIAKTLGVKVSYVYEMITVAYLVDHDLEDAIARLEPYAQHWTKRKSAPGSALHPEEN